METPVTCADAAAMAGCTPKVVAMLKYGAYISDPGRNLCLLSEVIAHSKRVEERKQRRALLAAAEGSAHFHCAFCRFDMGNTQGLRIRMRKSKSGNVFCSHACRGLFQEQEAIKRKAA